MSNSECFELFSDYLLNAKGASDNTYNSYMRDIRQLSEYLSDHCSCTIADAGYDELFEYISFLRMSGKSVSTVSRNIASIKCLYTFLCINQYIKINPSLKLVPDKTVHLLAGILIQMDVIEGRFEGKHRLKVNLRLGPSGFTDRQHQQTDYD